jgi:hypothetical protein
MSPLVVASGHGVCVTARFLDHLGRLCPLAPSESGASEPFRRRSRISACHGGVIHSPFPDNDGGGCVVRGVGKAQT